MAIVYGFEKASTQKYIEIPFFLYKYYGLLLYILNKVALNIYISYICVHKVDKHS